MNKFERRKGMLKYIGILGCIMLLTAKLVKLVLESL